MFDTTDRGSPPTGRWSLTPTPATAGDSPGTLVEIFLASVASHSERVAVEAVDATLTYAELAERARSLAGTLGERGIGRGDRVAVRVPSGTAELYTAIIGVLLAGAAYVPIDADDPSDRVVQILEGSGACATVAGGLSLTRHLPAIGARGGSRPEADDDASVIFTSGSTGPPKAVAVTHRSAAAFVTAESALWTVGCEDRVLAGLSVGFDASCEEIWLAWAHGAALVPAARALVRSGAELGDWLRERAVTVVSTVPTLAGIWDQSCLDGVRLLILGGKACPDALAWRLSEAREVWNTYGPTESTVVTTAARLHPGQPVTIGASLRGWEVAVLGPDGCPVPHGQPGELVIGGVGLGRYLNPALDRARYAPATELGWERAYRTGDIVRATLAGLSFVGRRDDQVKIGGRRIELGEIDAALAAVPGVRGACTTVRETAAGNRLLVGYVSGAVSGEQIRAELAHRLPAAMVPLVVVMDELPVAASGKVNRKALPWPPPRPAAGATPACRRRPSGGWRSATPSSSARCRSPRVRRGTRPARLRCRALGDRGARRHRWFGLPGPHVGWAWLVAGWLVPGSAPGQALVLAVARRALIGPVRPGSHPRYGSVAWRVWFLECRETGRVSTLAGTPWALRYARLMGHDVGDGARLGTLPAAAGRSSIGAGARVGTRTLLMPGARIGAGAEIEPGAVIDGEVGAGELWSGVPARRTGSAGSQWPAQAAPAARRPRLIAARFFAAMAIVSVPRGRLFALCSSLYTRPWLRLAGIAVGPRTEISTAVGLTHLTRFGAAAFADDDAVLAGARARDGWLHVDEITIGDANFLGNGALREGSTDTGSGSLVGVLTVAPTHGGYGTSWLGAPALELSRRRLQQDPRRTVDPPRRLILARLSIEAVRIIGPATLAAALGALVFGAVAGLGAGLGWAALMAGAPVALLGAGILATLLTAAVKWGLIGRYRAGEHPLWSWFVWRDEIVNSAQEQLAGTWLLSSALGTPIMSLYLRLLGAKVGRGVYRETLTITEFDLAHLGDGAVVNRSSMVETHLFHDRVMQIGPITVGAGASLGPSSALLPDSALGDGCSVGGRAVVMRGESLPARTCWHGAPVVAVAR